VYCCLCFADRVYGVAWVWDRVVVLGGAEMNKKQIVILIIGLILSVWLIQKKSHSIETQIYNYIFSDKRVNDREESRTKWRAEQMGKNVRIKYNGYLTLTGIGTGGLIYAFKNKKTKEQKEPIEG
jgi:hypothetical protein